jgi:SpoVK/Ycf46/Vps4 family AAA+-type ATPase
VKTEVRRLTSLLRVQQLRAEHDLPTIETSRHLVFTGNPGTGKTTVARLLSQIYRTLDVVDRGHLVETDRADLVAGYVGQTATKTKSVLESALGGTVLIDEAYALARGGENDFGREAIDTLVKFMEDHRDDLAVVVAGYPNEMQEFIDTNPGLQSRFARTLEFPDYTTDELVRIFDGMSGKQEYHLDHDARQQLVTVIEAEPRGRGFGNARFVRNVFEQAVSMQAVRLADVSDPTKPQLTTLVAADIAPV